MAILKWRAHYLIRVLARIRGKGSFRVLARIRGKGSCLRMLLVVVNVLCLVWSLLHEPFLLVGLFLRNSGIFAGTAWWACMCRQAAHQCNSISGFCFELLGGGLNPARRCILVVTVLLWFREFYLVLRFHWDICSIWMYNYTWMSSLWCL